MFTSTEDFTEILRNLGKSVISENYRDSLQSNLTPRISYRVSSQLDLKKDPSNHRLHDSPNPRPSNFSKGARFKRRNSLEAQLNGSNENPMLTVDRPSLQTEEYIEYPPFTNDQAEYEHLKAVLLTDLNNKTIEIEQLQKENLLLKEQLTNKTTELERLSIDLNEKQRLAIKEIALRFEAEQKAWEAELRNRTQKANDLFNELSIAKSNCEKLHLFIKAQSTKPAPEDLTKGQKDLLLLKELKEQQDSTLNPETRKLKESIEYWKRKASQLELSLMEYNGLIATIREYETRIGALMKEKEALKEKESLLQGELLASRARTSENDALKLKVNSLEIALTELKLQLKTQ